MCGLEDSKYFSYIVWNEIRDRCGFWIWIYTHKYPYGERETQGSGILGIKMEREI